MRSVAPVSLIIAAVLSLLPTGTFAIDPAASHVEFFVRDNRGGFPGVVRDVEATAAVREQGETFAADVDVRIDARTIATGIGLRDVQMRRDFLTTDRFPFITFHGNAVPIDRPGALAFRAVLRGSLTIKDTTRDIEIPVRVIALRDVYLVEGKVTIRMSDFRIPIPRFLFFVAEDPVEITLNVRFNQK